MLPTTGQSSLALRVAEVQWQVEDGICPFQPQGAFGKQRNGICHKHIGNMNQLPLMVCCCSLQESMSLTIVGRARQHVGPRVGGQNLTVTGVRGHSGGHNNKKSLTRC